MSECEWVYCTSSTYAPAENILLSAAILFSGAMPGKMYLFTYSNTQLTYTHILMYIHTFIICDHVGENQTCT